MSDVTTTTAATQTSAPTPSTPVAEKVGIAATGDSQGRVTPAADHDRVAMASRRPDGTPDQDENFEYIGPKDRVMEAAKEQLRQQRVSAVDVAIRGVQSVRSDEGVGSSAPDPAVQEIIDAHKDAEKGAEADAEAEVNERHLGLGDRADSV